VPAARLNMYMDLGLAGRVYLLTGASRGLGFAAAEALVGDGAHVIISSRDGGRVGEAVALLKAGAETARSTGTAHGIVADNAEEGTAHRLVAAALHGHGRLDGALISVGGPPRGTASAVTDTQWREAFESVFLGAVRLARTVAEHLAASGGGTVVFVLSSSVRAPLPALGISNGLRPGLAGVAKDMADEHGPHGVRVVSLLPGSILTDRLREVYTSPDELRKAATGIPLRRLGDPGEFGRVAAFVLSPAASYLTGVAIPVDGGALRAL
jgi:3-oxoacyl-[acyl-carrier protein] reductase